MKFSKNTWLCIAIASGVAVGLFFGEWCAFLKPINDVLIKTMQITIVPYIALSLVTGIGQMKLEELKSVGKKGGLLLVGLWFLGVLMCVLAQFTFPNIINASFYAPKEMQQEIKLNLIDLFVPENIFQSLSQGAVPAIVVFCILFGIALIKEDGKGKLKEFCSLLSDVIGRMAKIVMKVVPFAIFTLIAHTAGTISTSQIMTLPVYVLAFVVVALFGTFCLLPLVVMLFTGVSYRDFITTFSSAIFLGFSTRSSFLALPLVLDASRELLDKMKVEKQKAEKYTEILIPIAFTFPSISEFLNFIFLLFIAWLNKVDLDFFMQLKMVLTGVFLFFGSTIAAVRFLLEMLHLPADAISLYLSADSILKNFDRLLSVAFLCTFTACGATLMAGKSVLKLRRLVSYAVISTLVLSGLFVGLYNIFVPLTKNLYQGSAMLDNMEMNDELKIIKDKVIGNVLVYKTKEEIAKIKPRQGDVLAEINQTGVLRVGFNPDSLPFAFFNAKGDLVGLDIQTAYSLAAYLHCHTLELVQVSTRDMASMLNNGYCDVVMSGVLASRNLRKEADFTKPYMTLELAMVTLDTRKKEFAKLDVFEKNKNFKIAISERWIESDIFKLMFPHASLVPLVETRDFFQKGVADVLISTAQHASAWTLRYPTFTVIMPKIEEVNNKTGKSANSTFAVYVVSKKNSLAWKVFLDETIDIYKESGFYDDIEEYWIYGKGAKKESKRWSILKDVLHLVD